MSKDSVPARESLTLLFRAAVGVENTTTRSRVCQVMIRRLTSLWETARKANNRARTCQRTKREKVQVKARGERCVPTQEVLMSRPMEAERGSRGGE